MNLTERIALLLQKLSAGMPEREFWFQLAFLGIIINEPFYIFGRSGSGKSLLAKRLVSCIRKPKILSFGKKSTKYPDSISDSDLIIFHDFNPQDEVLKQNLQIAMQEKGDIPLFILGDIRPESAMRLSELADKITLTITLPESLSPNALCNLLQNQYSIENVKAEDTLAITSEERRQWLTYIKNVSLSKDILEILGQLSKVADKNNLYISIRQWMSVSNLIRAIAFFNGRNRTTITDTFFLGTAIWGKTSTSRILTQSYKEILLKQLLKDIPDPFEEPLDCEALEKKITTIAQSSNNSYDTRSFNGSPHLYYRITINGEPAHLYVPLEKIETSSDFHPFNELNQIETRVFCNYNGTSTCSIKIDSAAKGTNRGTQTRAAAEIHYEDFAKLPTYIIKENDPELINKKNTLLSNYAKELRDHSEAQNKKLMTYKYVYQQLKAAKDDLFINQKILEDYQTTIREMFDNSTSLLGKLKDLHIKLMDLKSKIPQPEVPQPHIHVEQTQMVQAAVNPKISNAQYASTLKSV